MMNKKRTRDIGRTKYLMFLPLAALLMIISNIEAVARTTKSIAKEVIQTVEQVVTQTPVVAPLPPAIQQAPQQTTPPQDKKKVAQDDKKKAEASKDDNYLPVFEVAEDAPQYPGGATALMKFISENVRYPEAAHKAGTQGRVIVEFIVEKDGTLSNIKVVKSVSPELDGEAIRVMSTMSAWVPGKQKGEPVRVKFTVPVMFRLSGGPAAQEIKDSKLSEVVVVGYGGKEGPAPVVFEVVEQMPKFPGGIDGIVQYLARSMKYPVVAQESKTEGRVIVQMVINKEGQVTSTRVIKSVSPELDAEAIRVVSSMPKWEPGMQRGQAVNVRYTLPITFRLEKPQHTPVEVAQ